TTGFTERFRGSGESYKSSRRRYFRLRPRGQTGCWLFGTYGTTIPSPAGFLKLEKILCSPRISRVRCAGSELVVLVFEQDVERGERSVTARNVLLQVNLVRFA